MWDVRSIDESEADLFRSRLSRAFGVDPDSDDGARDRFLELFDIARTFAAYDDGDIIGTGGAFTYELTVPGETTVPMGGTTIVSVQPTHRRKGVLSAMMRHHLDDVARRGEPVVGLWASETGIYGRFGFGTATYMFEAKLHAPSVIMATPRPGGHVRLVDPEDATDLARPIYERVRPSVAGMLSRSDAWWRQRLIRDPESNRGGKSARRFAFYEDSGETLGYAIYRQKQKWGELPEGEIHVVEVVAADPVAHRGLWSFLTNIDLYPHVEYWNMPIDDALPLHVVDSRRVSRKLSDALWIRLLDVPAALRSRRYETDGELVLTIDDDFWPSNSGTYQLDVRHGRAECRQGVARPPDITCSIDVLGHLYLGGGDAMAMARAGKIHGDPDAIKLLHRLFHTARAPWCQEIF